jgi:hypothetical protein
MKESILQYLDNPRELERCYRKDKEEFKRQFQSIYPQIQDNIFAQFWNERLSYESSQVTWGTFKDWQFVIIASLIAGVLAKFPVIFSIDEEIFYPRNIGFLVFPFVAAYFIRKNKISLNTIGLMTLLVAIAAVYINLLPGDDTIDTFVLACIHLPLLLWAALGFAFTGEKLSDLRGRLAYLRFNGDAVVMGGILLLSGLLLSGLTVGLFQLIGLNIEKFYFEYIGVFGLAAAPLVATHLTQTNPQLVNKVSPVIAKIFSPLVLVMLVIYLGAIVYSGKDPYNDREFLLLFNALLVGVIALVFFSVAESSAKEKHNSGTWVLFLLSLVTILVNGIALSAIIFRIAEWGITPNRMAVLGANVLMLTHLLIVSWRLYSSVSNKRDLQEVGISIVRYLPIYLIWAAIVVFVFPVIFGFK